MKMNAFTLGAVAGILGVTLAVPVFAQVSGTAAVSTAATTIAATTGKMFARPAPTQAQVTEMATRDSLLLKNIDSMVTVLKGATQAHLTALNAAATITDDTQREAAVKKAHEDMRATMEAAITANPELKGIMPFGGGHGGMMGHGKGDLAAKLGMTEAELKAAIDGGKTIEQIATEKGITLPARPMGKHGGWMHKANDTETNDDAPAATATSTSVTAQ